MTLELGQGTLERAIEAAEVLGLDAARARTVATTIEERQGYPADLYVLGLVGGTGVGKSSLLNAIADDEVSPAGARRPTTRSAVALLPPGYEEEAAPLLEWLGGAEVRTRSEAGPAVAIVDLPDLDSIEPAHAARVDAVLPRIDAVLWVTDPEKYDDAILHDRYLRRWMPRLARQALVVNKADRLAPADMERVCDDLRGRLRGEGLPAVSVLNVSALGGIEPVRDWLLEGASGKAVVMARLRRAAAEAVRELAASAGVTDSEAPDQLLSTQARTEAAEAATAAVLDVVGPRGLHDQAAAATLAQARASGGGPIQRAQRLLERGSGVEAQRADPEGYLRRWRDRGSLDRAIAPIRQTLMTTAGVMPAQLRPSVLATADPAILSERLARGIDATVGSPEFVGEGPRSRLWPAVGLLQLVATAALLAGIIWLVVLIASAGSTPVGTVDLPILGPMPTPAVLIIGGLLAAFLLDRLLRWHAGRMGREWADSILEVVSGRVSSVMAEVLTTQLTSMDEARHDLWAAAREIEPEA